MRQIFVITFFLAVCLSWSGAGEKNKGLTFREEISSYGDGLETKESSTVVWWDGRWMENSDEGAVIFDMSAQSVFLIDHKEKIWTGGPHGQFLSDMEKDIVNLVSKVKDTYGFVQPGGSGQNPFNANIKTELVGEEKVAGHKCKHFRIWQGLELKQELWIDPSISPVKYFDLPKLMPVVERFSSATAIFAREFKSREEYLVELAIQGELRKLFPQGLEIRSREYRDSKILFEKRILDIRPWEGTAAFFSVPPGYRQVPYKEYLEASIPTTQDILDPDDQEKH